MDFCIYIKRVLFSFILIAAYEIFCINENSLQKSNSIDFYRLLQMKSYFTLYILNWKWKILSWYWKRVVVNANRFWVNENICTHVPTYVETISDKPLIFFRDQSYNSYNYNIHTSYYMTVDAMTGQQATV